MAKENVTDDLRAELKTLADTLEEVLNSSADKSKEEMGKLRSKAESALKESRARLGETSEAILRQTRETAARADDYVRENPWTGVGIAPPSGWCWVSCCRVADYGEYTTQRRGPGQRVFSIGQRIVTLLVEMVETRLRLVVVELEEEKANLFQLLIMTGLTLLFAAFGLMSLLVLVIWAVDAQYRLHVMIATTVVLLLAAAIVGILTLRKARRSTLLRLTRKELENDRALLEEDKP